MRGSGKSLIYCPAECFAGNQACHLFWVCSCSLWCFGGENTRVLRVCGAHIGPGPTKPVWGPDAPALLESVVRCHALQCRKPLLAVIASVCISWRSCSQHQHHVQTNTIVRPPPSLVPGVPNRFVNVRFQGLCDTKTWVPPMPFAFVVTELECPRVPHHRHCQEQVGHVRPLLC